MAQQPQPLKIVCFGPLAVQVGGRPASPVARRPRLIALLIYLTLSPGRCRTRDHLTGVFWPEKPEGKAKHSLNEAVRLLRRALGVTRIQSDKKNGSISVSENRLDVDVLRFAALVDREPERAIALVRGEFLEGFHVRDAHDFDAWLTRERQHYQALAASALVVAADRELVEGDAGTAIALARRALVITPLSDRAVSLLMQAHKLAGDPGAALLAFQDFAARLKSETGRDVARSLAELAERLARETPRVVAKSSTMPEPPLIGREMVHRTLFETVANGIVSGPSVIVVTGPPGMGRTRLLTECATRLSLRGALILRARCLEVDEDARWSLVRSLARAGLAEAPGLNGASPASLGVLGALVPSLGERFSPREVADVAEMGAAWADALGAVAEQRPIALLVDDAHWADGASLAVLSVALRDASPGRVVLVLTAAEGVGSPSRELLRLKSDVGREVPGAVLRLEPLGQEDIGGLVNALAPWCSGAVERNRLSRRLRVESGGVPFVAVTLLHGLAKRVGRRGDPAWPPAGDTDVAPYPGSIPSLLRHALEAQLSELVEHQTILGAATICGDPLDVELIAQVTGRAVAEVEGALAAAEAHQVIRFAEGRYSFVAPVLADVAREVCLPAGERRRLERRACDVLLQRTDVPARALRLELLAHVAPDGAVAAQALALATDALTAGMRSTARRALASAERALAAASDPVLGRQLAGLRKEMMKSA